MNHYQSWFNEIKTTKMNKEKGQVKIYKMVLLLCMLDRGVFDWFKPVKAEDIALRFYRYLTDNKDIQQISFGDKGKERYINFYDEKYITRLIRNNPMTYWGKNHTHARYSGGNFWIDIKIKPNDYKMVYDMTKQLCLKRIEDETGIPFDIRIDLHKEYSYLQEVVEHDLVAESERETIIMARIGQGKFRNRLFEKYYSCIICDIRKPELLIASHIKPWRDSSSNERLDVNNGFILCPNHDKLFDKGFISFQESGNIITSREINQDIDKLNIRPNILYDLNSENKNYLEWHRDKVYVA